MTLLQRAASNVRTDVPKHWRGPMPDQKPPCMLEPKGGFYKKIPRTILTGEAPDLGVMVWALLRLSFDGQANVGSYRQFAQCLNLGHLSDTAIDKRFGAALKPLLGTWINRRRLPDNTYLYEAVLPADAAADRYAILRPSDIDLLDVAPPKGLASIEVGDLVAFCRWQLECGPRGWTVEPLRNIAERWNVTHPTMSRSRDRLTKLGLLKVVPRTGGRFTDLIWLEELYDPHWQVPSLAEVETLHQHEGKAADDPEDTAEVWKADGRLVGKPTAGSSVREAQFGRKASGRPDGSPTAVPIQGIPTKYSTRNETNLGGTSVPPLELATREPIDAPPPASRWKDLHRDSEPFDPQQVSARLVSRYPVFVNAKPHFRRAVIARLAAALARGLEPGHADRALARVADEGAYDAEFLLLRRALQQARADQLAGMCAECGGDWNTHHRGCAQFVDVWDDKPFEPTATTKLNVEDPLAILLRRPAPDASELVDDVSTVEWLIQQFALQLMDVSDREARLRAIVVGMRAKALPGQRHLIDQAAEHVRYALTRSMAS